MAFACASTIRRNTMARAAGLSVAVLLLTGCSAAGPEAVSAEHAPDADGYPTAHIHGMSVDPATNRVLLATHDGLYDVSASSVTKIGPTIDLMGFTTASDGTFYASGHPGPGVDLPDPIGLITSTDHGRTWDPLSRQGESDFHALAATEAGVVGYDGELLVSAEGAEWEPADAGFAPYQLAGTPRDSIVLATTEEGLQRSTDDGATWSAVPDAPLLMLTALSEGKAAGITPQGLIYTSGDAGLTWKEQGTVPGQAAAIATQVIDDSTQRIWVATEDTVQVSNDSGQTFSDLRSNHQ